MSESSETSELSGDQQSASPVTTKEALTQGWSGEAPALRLTRRRRFSQKPAAPYAATTPAQDAATLPAPRFLRLGRAFVGAILLVLAWVGLLAVVLLAEALWDVFPSQPHISLRLGLYVLGALGVCWLAVAAVACIVTGAFCLTLALTRKGW